MNAPLSAQCRTTLASGRVAIVIATRRPRSGRADIKCSAAGEPKLADRMQQVARLARHTEARIDSRDQVVISIDPAPGLDERDWELAVVLADRMVRGEWHAAGEVHANGWSDQWQLGRIDGHDTRAAGAILGGPGALAHLGGLAGHPDSGASVASARAWFPLHAGGIHDTLAWVDVSVYPLAMPGADEDEHIAVLDAQLPVQLAVRQALLASRHFDGRALGRWRTVVRFGQPRFQGSSFELALIMADRIARGREFVPRGRIIASGASAAWHAGQVDAVEGRAPKCALIAREALVGDRILLPKAWETDLPDGFKEAIRALGASVACIERIGII